MPCHRLGSAQYYACQIAQISQPHKNEIIMKTTIAALCLGLLATTNTATAGEAKWYADFDEAVAAAKEQKKDLLVDFTGSDWCSWCIKLDQEVFEHEEFVGPAQENYILVALDFPSKDEAKAKVPNPKRNEELKEKYEVGGFPTILMMTAEGEVFAQTGYQAGGPEKYIEHMSKIATSGKKAMGVVKEVLNTFEKATGKAKLAAWEKAAKTLAELDRGSPFAGKLAKVVRWAMTSDTDNAKGLKLRAVEALLKAGQFDDSLFTAGTELDPKNEKGLYEQVVERRFSSVNDDDTARAALKALQGLSMLSFKDKELGFSMTFRAAKWSNGPLADPEGAKKYAEDAIKIGSEDEEKIDELRAILDA